MLCTGYPQMAVYKKLPSTDWSVTHLSAYSVRFTKHYYPNGRIRRRLTLGYICSPWIGNDKIARRGPCCGHSGERTNRVGTDALCGDSYQ